MCVSIENFAIPSQQFQQKTFSSSSEDLCFARDEKRQQYIKVSSLIYGSHQLEKKNMAAMRQVIPDSFLPRWRLIMATERCCFRGEILVYVCLTVFTHYVREQRVLEQFFSPATSNSRFKILKFLLKPCSRKMLVLVRVGQIKKSIFLEVIDMAVQKYAMWGRDSTVNTSLIEIEFFWNISGHFNETPIWH